MAEEIKNQTQEEWNNAFDPYTPKYQKTYTELAHEKGKREQAALETEESQLFMHQFKEGIKKDNPALFYIENDDDQ